MLRTRTSTKEGYRTTVTLGGSGFVSRGFDAIFDAPKTDGVDISGVGGDVSHKSDVYKSGFLIRSTLMSLDGEVSPRSFRFMTFANAADFEKAVSKNMGVWAHQTAKRMYPTEYDAGGERKQDVINATLRRIEAHLKEAVTRANPMEEFSLYFEFSAAAVKKINQLQGLASFMGGKAAKEIDSEITQIFESADSWEERFLVIGERAKTERASGLITGLRWAQIWSKVQSKLTFQ